MPVSVCVYDKHCLSIAKFTENVSGRLAKAFTVDFILKQIYMTLVSAMLLKYRDLDTITSLNKHSGKFCMLVNNTIMSQRILSLWEMHQ